MDDIEVLRTTKFVSLDTHPANNALVITYDVLAIARHTKSGKELSRASKRHQKLINISLLDKLIGGQANNNNKIAIDLNALSADIISKCPLLSSDGSLDSRKKSAPGRGIDDIKLHLLYLINRAQGQTQAQRQLVGSQLTTSEGNRASARFALSSSASRRRPGSALTKRPPADSRSSCLEYGDVYRWVLDKEWPIEVTSRSKMFSLLVDHLNKLEVRGEPSLKQIDVYLDALYGAGVERFDSLVKLQQLYLSDKQLPELAEKRLLICALVRTLADINANQMSSNSDLQCELVLCCFICLTKYLDIYHQAFKERHNIAGVDLVGAHLGSLANFVGRLLQESKQEANLIAQDSYFHLTCEHLLLLGNLLQHEFKQIMSHLSSQLFVSLISLLQLLTRQLGNDLRIMSKADRLERSILLLSQLLLIIKKLTYSREFIQYLRGPKATNKPEQRQQNLLLDSLVNLLSQLQLSRPTSGQSSSDQAFVTDRSILNQFYELELMLLATLGNLMTDRRIKLRLIKRNILKSSLRNLVSFLASRNNLASFNKCPVLMSPLDCLYKLTCERSVSLDICKSKIILRCLFEYLLNSSLTLCQNMEQSFEMLPNDVQLAPMTEIKLEPETADHYLLSIWCNLSSHVERLRTIIGADINLASLQDEYTQLVCKLMQLFCKHLQQTTAIGDDTRLLVYMHLKLVANLTRMSDQDDLNRAKIAESDELLMEILATCSLQMIEQQLELVSPLVVESIWTICNLLLLDKAPEKNVACSDTLIQLMQRLFTFSEMDFETETDDDLILVSCIYLAIVAQSREICPQLFAANDKSFDRIVRATNFLLSNKANDKTILFAALFTLIKLTNHRSCRAELAKQLNTKNNRVDELVPKLTSFMLHHDETIAQLACRLVDRLVLVSQSSNQDSSGAFATRFATYNGKWLRAIQASRNELVTPPDQDQAADNWLEDEVESEGDEHEDDDEEPVELLEDAAELNAGSTRTSFLPGRKATQTASLLAGGSIEDEEEDEDEDDDFGGEDEEEDDELGKVNAPDFSVVDSNSMIKHLVSRQEFRQAR